MQHHRRTHDPKLETPLPLFRMLIDHSNDAIFVIDPQTFRVLDVNETACQRLQYDREELVHFPTTKFSQLPQDFSQQQHVERLHQQGGFMLEVHHRCKDGTTFPVEVSTSLITQEGREYIISVARDLRERKRTEANLKLFRQLINQSNDAIFVVDPTTGNFLDVNTTACTRLQYTQEELLQMRVEDISTAPGQPTWEERSQLIKAHGAIVVENYHRRKDGVCFPVEVNASWIAQEESEYFVAVARDITERKEAERITQTYISEIESQKQQLNQSLMEKQMLLKEIHHRVKNNLQFVASLLNLQTQVVQGGPAYELFREAEGRIASMTLIHEQLYQSDQWRDVPMAKYLETLANNLFLAHGVSSRRIGLELDIEDIEVGIDTAIPCGLIVNEVVVNSLKYAFPEDQPGTIFIFFKQQADEGLFLQVGDTGIGLPSELDIDEIPSLGLKLIRMFTEQLDGDWEIDRYQGTCYTIRFRPLSYKQRI